MKYGIQSSNINCLFGSGLSVPFLKTLGEIEQRLTELEHSDGMSKTAKRVILASIRKAYFDLCIHGNCKILEVDSSCEAVLTLYKNWFISLSKILLNRKNTLLNKQINLFTTNMDIFPEMALESVGIEYNDGFYGTISPTFGISNFKKSIFKTSQQYGVATELPVFNLYKLHGSVTWKMNEDNVIGFDHKLEFTSNLGKLTTDNTCMVDVFETGNGRLKSIEDMVRLATPIRSTKIAERFNKEYEKLVMVNPTKEKFRLTTLNRTYYELLRMYANELEKENTILFVMGFSFADEHIAEITLRAARSNPTLKIYIFAYSNEAEGDVKKNLKIENGSSQFSNIVFVPREKFKNENGEVTGEVPHDLDNINKSIFSKLAEETNGRR